MALLNDQQLKALSALLDQREIQLRGEVGGAEDAAADEQARQMGVVPDSVDIAEARRSGDIRHAETERDKEELMDIADARARLADGRYGECADCGEPIALGRLQVEPAARRCVACQTVYERSHPAMPMVATRQDLDIR